LPDAYFVDASARENSGDIKGALRLFEIALKLPENSRNEEFTYRTGQINLHAGNKVRAKLLFEQLAKSAKDPDWQKLAQQALVSIK
jgi:tetratricopeptide (TPR) repeat protein